MSLADHKEPWEAHYQPATEVFNDKEHLTRSATHFTLVQLSKLSLTDVVKKASAVQTRWRRSASPRPS